MNISKTFLLFFVISIGLISQLEARTIGDDKDQTIAEQRSFLEEKVYAFCNAVKTVDARGRKIDNPSIKQPIRCLDARLALEIFNNKSREEQFQSGEQRTTIDDTSILKDKSVGGYIFSTFFSGLTIWVKGKNNDGVFQRFSATVSPVLERTMVLFIILLSASAFFNKFTQYIEKGVKAFIAFVIVIAFLEWSTFEYWVFDPLLGLMINTMKVLFNAESLGLTEAIFGVDKHFDQLFSEIGEYTTLLEEKGAWYDVQIFKKIVAYLIIGMFGALYAIFTILIIVGFFGFMLLLGFAPVFMAIGIFNKGIFFSWLKTTMNYFLIPIFTAAVMSVTIAFITQAADAIGRLSPADSIFVKDIGFVFLVGIFSIGLHWKAPEFAAAITGGMASGAGSIVGTATAVGAAAWGLSKSPVGGSKNITNFASGFTGGNIGNSGSGGYRGGQLAEAAWNRLRTGGTK